MNTPMNITLKIMYSPDGIDSIRHLIKVMRESMHERQTFETCLYPDDKLIKALEREFNCTARKGVSGGCYGARDGKSYTGLTVYMSPDELPDRWIDSDGDEIVNYWHLLNDSGTCRGKVSDSFVERFQGIYGVETNGDNSCNYQGHDSDTPFSLYEINFSTYIRPDGSAIAVVEFHCGGDPRGNYTSPYLFEFHYSDDMYSALYPYSYLKEGEG